MLLIVHSYVSIEIDCPLRFGLNFFRILDLKKKKSGMTPILGMAVPQ